MIRSQNRQNRERDIVTSTSATGMMTIKAKSKYLANVISKSSDNYHQDYILHIIAPLLDFTSVKSLCDRFFKYFLDKIVASRSKFPEKNLNFVSVQKPEIKYKMYVF